MSCRLMRIRINGVNPITGDIVEGMERFEGSSPLALVENMLDASPFCGKDTTIGYMNMVRKYVQLFLDFDFPILDGSPKERADIFIRGLEASKVATIEEI